MNARRAVRHATDKEWARVCREAVLEPLRVRCVLGSPLCSIEPLVHLDALLAKRTPPVYRKPAAWSPTSASVLRPVALPVAWSELGCWECSALWAPDDTLRSISAWRMRPAVEYAHLTAPNNVPTSLGPPRAHDQRIDLWHPATMEAQLVGAADLVRELLAGVTAVGKKRSQGYGRVVRWEVEPCERAAWREWGGRLRRPIPDPLGAPMGVVPPYWYRPWWRPALAP